tara:strand:- start:169 stop:360 length:192 start_codon:yes stop_codon:yes gene_type:complete
MTKNQPDKKISSEKNISPSFVKLAMRNMVRKGNQSISHFGLTAIGFIGFILIVAWLGKPNLPH